MGTTNIKSSQSLSAPARTESPGICPRLAIASNWVAAVGEANIISL
jgi:hypothetical protein